MYFIIILISLLALKVEAQTHYTQTVRGKVIDIESQSPIPGVTVLVNSEPKIVTVSDAEGYFRLEDVPVGRITIHAMFISYQFVEIRDIELKSGKDLVLTIEMTEKVEDIEEVVITATHKDKPINEMATVSARSFTVEET